jgi:antitoxin PrlF
MTLSPSVEEADPVLESFLGLLSEDLASRPEQLKPVGVKFAERIQALVAGVEVDLDAELLEADQ